MTRTLIILILMADFAVAQAPKGKQAKSPTTPTQRVSNKPKVSSSADFKPRELTKLAVLVTAGGSHHSTRGTVHSTDAQRLVEDVFLECLLAKGHSLAARSDVGSVLREKRFQESGATDELAASVGKVLNVPAVLLVRVTDLSSDQLAGRHDHSRVPRRPISER